MRKFILVISALTLSGCAELGAFRQGMASYAQRSADESRIVAMERYCQSMTIGAWQRAYRSSPEKAEAWRKQCEGV